MYRNDLNVVVTNDLLEDMRIEGVMVSPIDKNVGILVLTKGMQLYSNELVVSIYELSFDNSQKKYHIVNELAAFSFANQNQAKEFVTHLPQMSALEMLLLQNQTTDLH